MIVLAALVVHIIQSWWELDHLCCAHVVYYLYSTDGSHFFGVGYMDIIPVSDQETPPVTWFHCRQLHHQLPVDSVHWEVTPREVTDPMDG